jgi:hypothetical protein
MLAIADEGRLLPTKGDNCRRMETIADEWRQLPTKGRQLPTNGDNCRRMETISYKLQLLLVRAQNISTQLEIDRPTVILYYNRLHTALLLYTCYYKNNRVGNCLHSSAIVSPSSAIVSIRRQLSPFFGNCRLFSPTHSAQSASVAGPCQSPSICLRPLSTF